MTTTLRGSDNFDSTDIVDRTCTAWVNFDGATPTINDSFNVASVVKTGTSTFTITFTTAMSNNDYAAVISVGNVSAQTVRVTDTHTYTTTTFKYRSGYLASFGADLSEHNGPQHSVVFFGGA